MTENAKLRVYGENGATFLIFQELASRPGAVQDVLLARLKQFGSRVRWKGPTLSNLEVWLFPSFGKGWGFGEPDALVVGADDKGAAYAFWIEVETTIDCKTAKSALRNSLTQLWRFFLFQQALRVAAKKVPGKGLVLRGHTVKMDKKTVVERRAHVWLAGHKVLGPARRRLAEAANAENDHYVLFSVDRPKGESGHPGHNYKDVIKREAERLFTWYHGKLQPLPLIRSWYAHWNYDLRRDLTDFDLSSKYIRIKK